MEASSSESDFKSMLPKVNEKLVAELLAECSAAGWRDATEFLAQFPVTRILSSLKDEDDLRVRMLVRTTGTHQKIAAKKSIASATEDIQLALDEGTTTAGTLFELYSADDWVRLLGAAEVWSFVTGDKFWTKSNAVEAGIQRIGFILARAFVHEILSPGDVTDAIPLEELTQHLTSHQLRGIVRRALAAGHQDIPFTEAQMMEVVPLTVLLSNIPMSRVWEDIILARVAAPAGLVDGGMAPQSKRKARSHRPAKPPPAPPASPSDAVPADAVPGPTNSPPSNVGDPPAASSPLEAGGVASGALVDDEPPLEEVMDMTEATEAASDSLLQPPSAPSPALTGDGNGAPTVSAPPPPPARGNRTSPPPLRKHRSGPPVSQVIVDERLSPEIQKVCRRLASIERLPPGYDNFPPAVLHSIESMYSDLQATTDAQDQLTVIQESFPNETWRAKAMLALLELLNPTLLSASESVVEESADSLSIRLLTEERQRSRNATSNHAPTATSAPPRPPTPIPASPPPSSAPERTAPPPAPVRAKAP